MKSLLMSCRFWKQSIWIHITVCCPRVFTISTIIILYPFYCTLISPNYSKIPWMLTSFESTNQIWKTNFVPWHAKLWCSIGLVYSIDQSMALMSYFLLGFQGCQEKSHHPKSKDLSHQIAMQLNSQNDYLLYITTVLLIEKAIHEFLWSNINQQRCIKNNNTKTFRTGFKILHNSWRKFSIFWETIQMKRKLQLQTLKFQI